MSFTSGEAACAESRWSDVYLLTATRAVSVCGDFLAATTLALVLQQRGHGGLAVSGLLVAASLPVVLLAPIAGRIADRADSRTVLVLAGAGQALACLALAFVTSPLAIIGLVALLACGLAIVGPTVSALLPGMVRPADLAKASGLLQTTGVIGMLIAPALAGVLVGQTGSRTPLLIDAASYLALIVAGLAIRTRRSPGQHPKIQGRPFRVRDDRTLTVLVVALAATVAGINAINVFDVFFIRDTLAASTVVYGLVAAAWSAGMLIGSVGFGRAPRRLITVPALMLLVAGSCLPVLAGAAVGSAVWLIPLWVLGGICNGGINVYVMVIVTDRTPAESRGGAFAALGGAVQAASLLGLLVAGPLVEHFEPRWLVAGSGGIGLFTALAGFLLVRREPPAAPVAADPEPARDSVGV